AHLRIPSSRLRDLQPRTAIERVIVALRRIDRLPGVHLMRKRQRIPELREQPQLEASQHRRLFRVRSELDERRFVIAKQLRVRILAREELEQELGQVEAAQQGRTADQRQPAAPLGLEKRLELPRTRPRERKRLKGLDRRAQLGSRSSRTARHQRYASVRCRHRLDDDARFAVGIRVQDERRLVVAPLAWLSHAQYPSCVSMRSSFAQPGLTRTQTSRNTLPPNKCSMSRRAPVAIAFMRDPPSPSRIARWLAFSTKTVA